MSARRRRSTVTVVAFDVLQLNGRRLLDYDIAGRREALERLVRLSDSALTAVATFDRLRPRRRADLLRTDADVRRRLEAAGDAVPTRATVGRLAQGQVSGVAC